MNLTNPVPETPPYPPGKLLHTRVLAGTILEIIWGPTRGWEHDWYYLLQPLAASYHPHWIRGDEVLDREKDLIAWYRRRDMNGSQAGQTRDS